MMTIVDASHCTSIGKNAFKDCANLTLIKLPADCRIDPAAGKSVAGEFLL